MIWTEMWSRSTSRRENIRREASLCAATDREEPKPNPGVVKNHDAPTVQSFFKTGKICRKQRGLAFRAPIRSSTEQNYGWAYLST